MNVILEHLIPKEIVEVLDFARFDLDIVLECHSFNGVWPSIQILVDNQVVYNDIAKDEFQFKFSKHLDENQKVCNTSIILHKKDDNFTKVNDAGEIVENQGVIIKQILVNDIDLIKTNLIHNLGKFHLALSDSKFKFFKEHGINTEPSSTLNLFENGEWTLTFNTPVLSYLSSLQSYLEPAEQGPWEELILEMYNKILVCKELENELKIKGIQF